MKTKILFGIISSMVLSKFSQLNAQVGINTSTPQASLDIQSKGNTASTKALKINNSGNTEIVTITDAGRLGVGASIPDGPIHVSTTDPNGIIVERASTAAIGAPAYFILRRNNSATTTSNGAVTSGNGLGAIIFSGNTGNGYEGSPISAYSSIMSYATENFSTVTQGSELRFYTVPNGSAANAQRLTITNDGKVGVGTNSPQQALHSIGTLRFENVNAGQAAGMVLTANDNLGTATWQRAASNVVTGTLGGGYNLPFAPTSSMSYTGSFITLPPGKWMLTISLLLIPNGTLTVSDWMFVRSTFSEQNLTTIGDVGVQSSDVIRPTLMSFQMAGPYSGGQKYNVATGSIQINNTSGAAKTYRYIVGNTQASGTVAGAQLNGLGGSWSENAIYAIATN